jgi:hypothetical protein
MKQTVQTLLNQYIQQHRNAYIKLQVNGVPIHPNNQLELIMFEADKYQIITSHNEGQVVLELDIEWDNVDQCVIAFRKGHIAAIMADIIHIVFTCTT